MRSNFLRFHWISKVWRLFFVVLLVGITVDANGQFNSKKIKYNTKLFPVSRSSFQWLRCYIKLTVFWFVVSAPHLHFIRNWEFHHFYRYQLYKVYLLTWNDLLDKRWRITTQNSVDLSYVFNCVFMHMAKFRIK